ncbi:MAG: transketolase C-terminal domain-containing protein [Pseudomonadota bacterium]
MRNTFISTLCSLATLHKNIFLLCGDLGFSVLEPFADQFPDRYLNVGIAEQNMTQVAVGLAFEGYNVFTYSIGNFPTLRCIEQIRYDVCYHEANVKIVAVGAGYAYGSQGVSHHTTEDLAILRSLPNMTVCSPSDPVEAKAAAYFMAEHKGPAYIRLNKTGEECIHDPTLDLHIAPGRLIEIQPGKDSAILATGTILSQVIEEVRQAGENWAVFSAPFIGGYDPIELIKLAMRFKNLYTIEEHQLNGGFGSSIIEALSDLYSNKKLNRMPYVHRIAIPNQFLSVSGSQHYLRTIAGLTVSNYFD